MSLNIAVALLLFLILRATQKTAPLLPNPSTQTPVFLLWATEIILNSFAPKAMLLWVFPALVIMWRYATKPFSWWAFGLRPVSLGWILAAVVMGAAAALPSLIFWPAGEERIGALGLFFLCLVSPVYEELLYRRLMLLILSERFGPARALVLAAAAFTLTHLPARLAAEQSAVLLLSVFVAGLLTGQLFLRTGNILSGLAFHITYNSLTLLWP